MALLKDDLEALRRVPMFSGIDSRRLRLLAFTAPRLTYDKGEALFHAGDDGNSAYVIMEGSVDILLPVDGKEVRVATLGKYDIIGETSLLSESNRIATVRAQSPVEALKIKKGQFCELVRSSPEMALSIMRHLSEQLHVTAQEYAELKRRECARQDKDPATTPEPPTKKRPGKAA